MNEVTIVGLGYSTLYDSLIDSIEAHVPVMNHSYTEKHGSFLEQYLRNMLPDGIIFSDVESTTGESAKIVIKVANELSAKVVMISSVEALLRPMRPNRIALGQKLKVSEDLVLRTARNGLVIRIPVLDTDPKITAIKNGAEVISSHDQLFSLANASEVADIVVNALNSGWTGLHQLGGPAQTLRQSTVLGKPRQQTTYDYSLPSTGTLSTPLTPAQAVWDSI